VREYDLRMLLQGGADLRLALDDEPQHEQNYQESKG